jgi:hypothetical protein
MKQREFEFIEICEIFESMAHTRRMESAAKSFFVGRVFEGEELSCSTLKGKLKEQHKKY